MAAPDFELPDAEGRIIRLSGYRGVNPVVVYFYPKDDTSVCTKQACTFRDEFSEFQRAGAVILGISGDSGASHRAFVQRYSLPFSLLSDKGGRVRKLYGVGRVFGLFPGRATFVIDREGTVRHTCWSLIDSDRHVRESLSALRNA